MPVFNLADLKICFIAGTLGQGGAERQLYYMLMALRQAGSSLRLICLTRGEFWEKKIRELGVPVTWVGQSKSKAFRLARIMDDLHKQPADVLQSQHFYTNLYAAVAARALNLREVGAIRCDTIAEVRSGGEVFGRLNLRTPRVIAANSESAIRRAIELGVPPSRLHLLPNVVDTERFRVTNRAGKQGVRLVAVGRLVEQKKIHHFLNIVAGLRKRARTTVRATIVGEGPQRQQLERQAHDLGLPPGVVEFTGASSEMETVYREADILVLTSAWEGTPNVILEAMASGLPVVATRAGGVPEIVRHGETGFLAEIGDERSMTEALLKLIEDPLARAAMGARAHSYIESNRSPRGLLHHLAEIYQSALS